MHTILSCKEWIMAVCVAALLSLPAIAYFSQREVEAQQHAYMQVKLAIASQLAMYRQRAPQ